MRGRPARPVLRGPRLGNEPGLPDGARGPDGAQVKVFGVYDHDQHLLLTQTAVVGGDEIAAFTTAQTTLCPGHPAGPAGGRCHRRRASLPA
jgi:hypothetical protein